MSVFGEFIRKQTNLMDTWEARHQSVKDIHCGGGWKDVGCGEPLPYLNEIYRCADCDTPFHKHCLLKHFEKKDGKQKDSQ